MVIQQSNQHKRILFSFYAVCICNLVMIVESAILTLAISDQLQGVGAISDQSVQQSSVAFINRTLIPLQQFSQRLSVILVPLALAIAWAFLWKRSGARWSVTLKLFLTSSASFLLSFLMLLPFWRCMNISWPDLYLYWEYGLILTLCVESVGFLLSLFSCRRTPAQRALTNPN